MADVFILEKGGKYAHTVSPDKAITLIRYYGYRPVVNVSGYNVSVMYPGTKMEGFPKSRVAVPSLEEEATLRDFTSGVKEETDVQS